jgi:hypothetical protein
MSVDRYLAVVHAIDSMAAYRTIKNTTKCIMYDSFSLFFSLTDINLNLKIKVNFFKENLHIIKFFFFFFESNRMNNRRAKSSFKKDQIKKSILLSLE